MAHNRQMRVPAAYSAELECCALAITSRHIANPIDDIKGNIFFTGAAFFPKL